MISWFVRWSWLIFGLFRSWLVCRPLMVRWLRFRLVLGPWFILRPRLVLWSWLVLGFRFWLILGLGFWLILGLGFWLICRFWFVRWLFGR
mgnify:CR=1 FL=1